MDSFFSQIDIFFQEKSLINFVLFPNILYRLIFIGVDSFLGDSPFVDEFMALSEPMFGVGSLLQTSSESI